MNPLARARLEVLGAAFLFSTGGAAIKAADFTGWQIAGLRSGVAAIAVWLLIPSSRQLRRGVAKTSLMVALAYAATLTLFVLANRLTTAANTIFLQATAPIYIVLLGPLLLRERVHRRDLGFLAAVAGGMALFFVGKQATFATAPNPLAGNILAAISGVTYAGLLLGFRWLGTRGASTTSPVAWGNLLALLLAIPNLLPIGAHGAGDWAIIAY
ncbi:MAG: DMT family transporter, partial [Gemmatimonadota bacterium]|nr:DMT family transporter [Gemmatimonadota bacterium]